MTTPSRSGSGAPISRLNRPGRGCRLALALGAGLCLLAAGAAAAQDAKPKPAIKPYALIFATVFEADGRLAYGVPVKVRRADQKKTLQEQMSDHSGEVAFRVPPGPADYVVWADVKPPKKRDKSQGEKHLPGPGATGTPGLEVRVHVDNDERVDIGLHLNP